MPTGSTNMIAVIFESMPHADRKDAYLDAAAALRPQLEKIDGFISIERFESLVSPGKILSPAATSDGKSVRQGVIRQLNGAQADVVRRIFKLCAEGFGLTRIAKALNAMMGLAGKVFGDHYHEHLLRSPTELINAIRYVLGNAKHHFGGDGGDPYWRFRTPYVQRFSIRPARWRRTGSTSTKRGEVK